MAGSSSLMHHISHYLATFPAKPYIEDEEDSTNWDYTITLISGHHENMLSTLFCDAPRMQLTWNQLTFIEQFDELVPFYNAIEKRLDDFEQQKGQNKGKLKQDAKLELAQATYQPAVGRQSNLRGSRKPLRFPIGIYIPPDQYVDCDQHIATDCGVDPEFPNCFGCGRPKQDETHRDVQTHCMGFPNCPESVPCLFCQDDISVHAGKLCPKLWASSEFLLRYASIDTNKCLPKNIALKPNEEEAAYLAREQMLSIRSYADSAGNKNAILNWNRPSLEPRVPIKDANGLTQKQRQRQRKRANENKAARKAKKARLTLKQED